MSTAQAVSKPVQTDTQSALLQRVIATLDVFPLSRADIVRTVMSLTADIETGIDKLSEVISTDPALTGKILRLSNSPFYGRMRQVASLHQAIMILGFQTIRSLVVATSTATMFKGGNDREIQDRLWQHSLATALGSRLTARRINPGLREEAFIVGLMHDIGKPVLLQRFPDEYKPVLRAIREQDADPLTIERENLGFTHGDLGYHILEHWNFPTALANAAGRHHDPQSTDPETPEHTLAHIVHLTNAIAKAKGYWYIEKPAVELASLSSAKFFEFGDDVIAELGEELEAGFSETVDLFAA